jgi:hypothetical protein
MTTTEIAMIVSEYSAMVARRICKDMCVINALAASASLLDRQHILSKAPQLLNNRERKILIGIKSRHA